MKDFLLGFSVGLLICSPLVYAVYNNLNDLNQYNNQREYKIKKFDNGKRKKFNPSIMC